MKGLKQQDNEDMHESSLYKLNQLYSFLEQTPETEILSGVNLEHGADLVIVE